MSAIQPATVRRHHEFQFHRLSATDPDREVETQPHEHLDIPLRELKTQSEPRSESDIPEKPTPVPSRWHSLTSDTWFYEIIAINFSILCFVATICVLWVYDQKPVPLFSYGVTLNTMISILATGCKTSLVFLLGGSIGQLKWIWFQDARRPVRDIQSFDDASRGPWGSLVILLQDKGRSLVSLGAAIMLLAIPFDPFMQQMLRYPLKEISTVSPQAVAKQSFGFFAENPRNLPDFGMKSAINAAIWSDGFEVPPSCPSGNCTWPTFRSVGLCSRCHDLTAASTLVGCENIRFNNTVRPQSASCDISLPRGQSTTITLKKGGQMPAQNLAIPLGVPWASLSIPTDVLWTFYPQNSEGKSNSIHDGLEYPLGVITHAALGLPTDKPMQPAQCGKDLSIHRVSQCELSVCARTYQISVSSGVPSINTTFLDYGEYFIDHSGVTCWKPKHGAPIVDKPHLLNPSHKWENTTDLEFCPVPEKGILDPLAGVHTLNYAKLGPSNTWSNFSFHSTSEATRKIVDIGLEHAMDNVAASLTKLNLDRSNGTVDGTVSHIEVIVAVNWMWMIPPAVILVACIVFLAWVILINRDRDLSLWKSSVLPILYHGRDDDLLPDCGEETTSVSQMEETAKAVDARLQILDTRRRLMRRDSQ